MSNGLYVSAREAARILGKDNGTIRRWVDTGQLKADISEQGGRRVIRIHRAALLALKSQEETEQVQAAELTEAAALGMDKPETHVSARNLGSYVERAISAETRLRIAAGLLADADEGDEEHGGLFTALRHILGGVER